MKRLFAAIKINPGNSIIEMLNTLKNEFSKDSFNWVNPENMHITLKFFGDTPDHKTDSLSGALKAAALGHKTFSFSVEGFGTFGSIRFPKVMWLGINHYNELNSLYQSINEHLAPLGYIPDKPVFKPHLTLARIRELRNIEKLHELEAGYADHFFQDVTVDYFSLYQSILKPTGPIYKAIETWRF